MATETKKPAVVSAPKSMMQRQRDYVSSISNGLKEIIGDMDNYQAVCGYNILTQINVLLQKQGLNFLSPNVDKETINNAIKYVIVYRLNTDNKEVFAIVRNEKRGDSWVKIIEVKPQYKGVLKILSTYGRDVERVYPEWIVREGDDFKYQTFKGVEVVPPEWQPHGTDGKVRLVVVPIKYKDGFIDYRIAERESVATNIKAQIKQSLISEKDEKKKTEILAMMSDMNLDDLLSNKTLAPIINETYTGLSSEEMIITKLVLNAVKRVQIDYSSALARELNEKTFDNSDVYTPHHNAEEILAMSGAPMIEGPEVDENGEVKPEVEISTEPIKINKTEETVDDIADLFKEE